MSPRRAFAFLLPALLLSACAITGTSPDDDAAEVARLMAEQRFGAALTQAQALGARYPDDTTLVKLRNEVIYQAFRFEQQTVAEAEGYQQGGDWAQALATLQAAIARYPESATLQKTLTTLKAQQQARLAELDINLMINRADWLLSQRDALTERRRLAGASWRDERRLTGVEDELQRLQPPLLAQGEEALKRGDLALAERVLTLSQHIAPTPQAQAALEAIVGERRRLQAISREQQRKSGARKARSRLLDLLEQTRVALGGDDLAAARDHLAAAASIDASDPAVQQLARALKTRMEARITALIAQGNTLYRRGRFGDARDLWREAVLLDPDNTLARARLERAERVIDKLESLRMEQAGPPAAQGSETR